MPVGFYGKLPSHGDFIAREIADAFVDRWDAWLQAGVGESRQALGEGWLGLFLTSPVWRFAFERGVVGASAWAGILMPSVDRVGRYFPLTVVAELPGGVDPHCVSVAAAGWFDWVEAIARRALGEEFIDLAALHEELRASETMLAASTLAAPALPVASLGFPGAGALWRFALGETADMGVFHARLSAAVAGDALAPLALWWSAGSEHVAPSVLYTRGLPPAATFRDLLQGAWSTAWHQEAGSGGRDATAADPAASAFQAPLPVRFQSAAITDVGHARADNQDAYVERGQEGLWLVADGMGGHRDGATASQLVAQLAMVAELSGDASAMANGVAQACHVANAQLRQRAASEPGFDAGTTVVALCVRDGIGIVQWAGDSRLYRLREGRLEQLTRDHTLINEPANRATEADAHVITRAVGGADVLELDQRRVEVRVGDRYLLCSDGLYGDLSEAEIVSGLAAAAPGAAATALLSQALAQGGHDNTTVVIVDVEATRAAG